MQVREESEGCWSASMARKLVPRIIHLANMPLRLMLPASRDNITEFSLRTVPSASKIEIKRVLQSVYGLNVSKVNTLNMDGKKKKRAGGWLLSSPAYKKAYVVLKNPISLPDNLFPFNFFEEEERKMQELEEPGKKQVVNRSRYRRGRRQEKQ